MKEKIKKKVEKHVYLGVGTAAWFKDIFNSLFSKGVKQKAVNEKEGKKIVKDFMKTGKVGKVVVKVEKVKKTAKKKSKKKR
tara:strand:- start:1158 stop:1400 length:243 start_codon:yes stop_codon:yes gene_type:complete